MIKKSVAIVLFLLCMFVLSEKGKMDDIQDFFRLTLDTSDLDLDGEVDLYNYRPETKDVEDSTVLDVLEVAEMTIKLLDAIKLHFRLDILDKQEHTIVWFVKR